MPVQAARTARPWRMEDLFSDSGARGRAEAAARYEGNASARQALDDLRRAVADLTTTTGDTQ